MVNDRLRELRLSLSRIGTTKLAVRISRYPVATVCEIIPRPCQDHSTFMKICGAFALQEEPGFQSSLLWWRPESGLEQSRGDWGHAFPIADGILAWCRAGAAAQREHAARA
jgi:hypothetical protein